MTAHIDIQQRADWLKNHVDWCLGWRISAAQMSVTYIYCIYNFFFFLRVKQHLQWSICWHDPDRWSPAAGSLAHRRTEWITDSLTECGCCCMTSVWLYSKYIFITLTYVMETCRFVDLRSGLVLQATVTSGFIKPTLKCDEAWQAKTLIHHALPSLEILGYLVFHNMLFQTNGKKASKIYRLIHLFIIYICDCTLQIQCISLQSVFSLKSPFQQHLHTPYTLLHSWNHIYILKVLQRSLSIYQLPDFKQLLFLKHGDSIFRFIKWWNRFLKF